MGPGNTTVISDDTDVFVLLLHFISTGDIKENVLMQPTSADSDKEIDITATYHKHISIYLTPLLLMPCMDAMQWVVLLGFESLQ